ncbi:MAG: AmmeMemoRadiSam system protein A [Bacteroidota bacterium]|nr:AmmeMemoRadiSam system protein A [Bacteroidota bacterium]
MKTFQLTNSEKEFLLRYARHTLENSFSSNKEQLPVPEEFKALQVNCGAFVSLYINEKLRGCIGTFTESAPLYRQVAEMTLAAAFRDHRFTSVDAEEIPDIKIEISVLTPLKKISSIDEIILGKHGIYLMKGNRGGTFLPQVATKTGWTVEEFLGYCAREKAGLGWDGWKDADIYTYEAIVFGEKSH